MANETLQQALMPLFEISFQKGMLSWLSFATSYDKHTDFQI